MLGVEQSQVFLQLATCHTCTDCVCVLRLFHEDSMGQTLTNTMGCLVACRKPERFDVLLLCGRFRPTVRIYRYKHLERDLPKL